MTIAPFNNKVFFIILKIIVVLSTYGYISCKLYNSKEIPGFVYESITFSKTKTILIIIILILMIINWLLEAVLK